MRLLILALALLPSIALADSVRLLDDKGHAKVTFKAEIADTDAEHEQGLMYRKDVPFGTGMLFVFDPPRQVMMWMKNTYVPLDMVYTDRNGKVTYLVHDAKPGDLTPVGSQEDDTAYVLELKAGSIKRYNILLTDRLAFPKNVR